MSDPSDIDLDGGGSNRASAVSAGLALVVVVIAVMWTIELVDSVLLDDELQGNGIAPRDRSGLEGIAFAPLLHLGWPHLIANTIPFLVLGGLVSLWGWQRWLAVTTIIVFVGGIATWLVARSGIHIGVSGVVFGYFGFLLAAVFYERRLWPVVPAVIAIVAYGSAVVAGIAPTEGVSWEGHIFGALAGVLAARVTASRQ